MVLPILAAARAAAVKKTQAATAKASRMRAKGVEVAGTTFDPRKPLEAVRSMNSRQLAKYVDQLDAFNNRNFKLRATRDGEIIPPQKWAMYELAERRYNKTVDEDMRKYGNLRPPNSGMSIAEREKIRGDVKATANVENLVYSKVKRDPRNVKDLASLEKLQAQLERKNTSEYVSAQIAYNRASCYSMIDDIGAADLRSAVEKLTDEQFNILWSKTRFREVLKEIYLSQHDSKGDRNYSGDDLDDAFDLVNWAATINAGGEETD